MKKSYPKAIYGLMTLVCILMIVQQVLAVTPAGTVIGNAATATYTDEDNNEYTTTSNIVQTVVLPICAVDITVDQTAYDVAPDQEAYIPVEIKNISNGTRSFTIATTNVALAYPNTIYRDTNQNGVVDPGESAVAAAVELNMDETGYFIVRVDVPAAALDGDEYQFNITATDDIDNTCTETTPDITTTVVHDALMVANKQVDYTVSEPGGTLTYTIQFQNIGTDPARSFDGWSVDVDDDDALDAGAEGIFVTDELPTDTVYAGTSSGQPANGYVVFSVNGTDWYRNTAVVGGDANVTHIGFFIPDSAPTDDAIEDVFAVDQQGSLTFDVTIGDPFNDPGDAAVAQDAASRVDNQAFVYYNDSTDITQEDTPTNWVHTIIPSSATADISIGGWDSSGVKWSWVAVAGEWQIGNNSPTWEEDDSPVQDGTGNDGDYQDDNYASNVPAGSWVTFEHQVRNNDENNEDLISLATDPNYPNLPNNSIVEFWNSNATVKLIDNNADGSIDLGTIPALGTKDFIIKIFIPSGAPAGVADGIVDHFIDIQAISGNKNTETDLSRDNIDGIVPPSVDIAERGDAGDNTNNDSSDDNTVAAGNADGDDITEADLAPNESITPGESKYYELQLVNIGESPDTYSLEAAYSVAPVDDDTTFRFLMDPDCSLTANEPSGDEYEVVDTPLLGGTFLTQAAGVGDTVLTVDNTASFSTGDSVIIGLGGSAETYTVSSVSTTNRTITVSVAIATAASIGDHVSESVCIILAVDTTKDTGDGDYNVVVTATSSLNNGISNNMDVFMRVEAVCGVSISPDHSDQLPPGGTTTYQHIVTNSGNYAVAARITINPPGGSLLNYRILDSAGAEVGGTTFSIANFAEGASQTFYVKVFASSTTPTGTVEELALTVNAYAVGDLDGAVICSDVSKDTTTIIDGFLILEKDFLKPIPDYDSYDYINDRCNVDGGGVVLDGIPGGGDPNDSAGPCDIITYQVRYTNIGEEDALIVVINDAIPENTEYVTGSLHVDTNCNYAQDEANTLYGPFFVGGTLSDAGGDDVAEYSVALDMVTFRVGTGANGTDGGTVVPNGTGCISFKVRIK